MKWFIAFASLSLLASCSTHPWMVGSANDKPFCGKDGFPGGGPLKIEAIETAPEPQPISMDQSGK